MTLVLEVGTAFEGVNSFYGDGGSIFNARHLNGVHVAPDHNGEHSQHRSCQRQLEVEAGTDPAFAAQTNAASGILHHAANRIEPHTPTGDFGDLPSC